MTEEKSFCRICTGLCGVRVKIDERGRLAEIRGDHDHPLTQGYACIKGIAAVEAHNSPNRLLHTMKRMPNGRHEPIGVEQALDEIAEKLQRIVQEDGPQAVAGYRGTMSGYEPLSFAMHTAWMAALGSGQWYSTLTIDQSAKFVTSARLGSWDAGKPFFNESDVFILVGGNPLVSIAGPGFMSNPAKTIKAARTRGVKLIVIDPRCTETASQADIFLQPHPGEDPTHHCGSPPSDPR